MTKLTSFLLTWLAFASWATAQNATIQGEILNPNGQGICEVLLELRDPLTGQVLDQTISSNQGTFQFAGLNEGQTYTLEAHKPGTGANGVSIADIVAIAAHILGLQPFTSDLQVWAADANLSTTVTTLDLIILRRIIVGIDELNVPHWLFASVGAPNWQPQFAVTPGTPVQLIGLRRGDVNGTANPCD